MRVNPFRVFVNYGLDCKIIKWLFENDYNGNNNSVRIEWHEYIDFCLSKRGRAAYYYDLPVIYWIFCPFYAFSTVRAEITTFQKKKLVNYCKSRFSRHFRLSSLLWQGWQYWAPTACIEIFVERDYIASDGQLCTEHERSLQSLRRFFSSVASECGCDWTAKWKS